MNRDRYADRAEAGRLLAGALGELELDDPVVLAMPRGGVPVGREVADALHAPLDVLVIRKVGAPGHEELGLGAVGERGVEVLDDDSMRRLGLTRKDLESTISREQEEVRRRVERYRQGREPVDLAGRDAVIVDDGVATGVSARAAVGVLRQWEPARIILAVPVGAPPSLDELAGEVDELVCPRRPSGFRAVGLWYGDFHQVDDQEVTEHLAGVADARARDPDGTVERVENGN